MKLKKMMAMCLTTVMATSLLTGCGEKKPIEAGSSGGENSAVGSIEAGSSEGGNSATGSSELEPVELVWNLVGTPQDDQAAVFAEVNKALKEKLNTTVQFNIIDWGSYDEKMKVAIATGEKFDLCFTSDWTNPYTTNAQKGAFYPLDDLLQEYGTNILAQVPESYWSAAKVDGNIYGVINYQVTARISGISFPEDVVEELGYDISKINKYEDLTDYFATVKENMPNMVPFLGLGETTEMPKLLTDETGFNIDYLSGPLAVRKENPKTAFNAIESPEFMEFCKMTQNWYDNGYLRKDVASIKDHKGEITTHNYAAFATGVGPGSAVTESARAGFPVVQTQVVPAYVSTGSIQSALTGISINSDNPERAMMVLDYLYSDKEIYNMLCYGIEGRHHEVVNDYSIRIIEGAGYNPGIAWEFGSWFNAKVVEGQDEDMWDQVKVINETALTSPVLGFVYNPNNVKNEMAQITGLIAEYIPGFLCGSVDPEVKIPELIEKMNAAGMDKIIADANEQLAEWHKNK